MITYEERGTGREKQRGMALQGPTTKSGTKDGEGGENGEDDEGTVPSALDYQTDLSRYEDLGFRIFGCFPKSFLHSAPRRDSRISTSAFFEFGT